MLPRIPTPIHPYRGAFLAALLAHVLLGVIALPTVVVSGKSIFRVIDSSARPSIGSVRFVVIRQAGSILKSGSTHSIVTGSSAPVDFAPSSKRLQSPEVTTVAQNQMLAKQKIKTSSQVGSRIVNATELESVHRRGAEQRNHADNSNGNRNSERDRDAEESRGFSRDRNAASRGLVPAYDARLYGNSLEPTSLALPRKDRFDRVIAGSLLEYADSIETAPVSSVTQDGQADLTFSRGGRTYGWTRRGIVLGGITLPAPLAAFLPLNRFEGNPSTLLRAEYPTRIRNQIQSGARVTLDAETFSERISKIRERRDRERNNARQTTPPRTP